MREGDETFEAAARARVSGQIGDDEFLRRTARTWRVCTARLWTRWRRKLPPSIGPEDVQQALMVLAVEYAGKCDPARLEGGSYGGYIVWCATRRAQRQIHKWRGARLSGHEGQNPGRPERCFASLHKRGGEDRGYRDDFESRVAAETPDPVEHVDSGRALLGRARSVREAVVLLALQRAGGDVEAAGAELWGAHAARVESGARSRRHAVRICRSALERLGAGSAREPGFPVPDDDLFELDEPEELWERALRGRARDAMRFEVVAREVEVAEPSRTVAA
jgi:hypothetical protein